VKAITHKIDVHVLFVCRPMTLEVIKKYGPIERKVVRFEILKWKREAVVDADESSRTSGKLGCDPFSNPSPSPIFSMA
jgi:septum formation topological specificity factor MinE